MASIKRQRNEAVEIHPVAPDVEPPAPRKMVHCVVRIQLPFWPMKEDAPALLYNEDKTIVQEIPVTRALRARFRPGEYRAHFHAGISKEDVEIGDRAEGQGW